ncbi:gluconate:H+ symporter [Pseudonocardia sp. Ae717_Ps2]|uniref:GntP family permease n=1 Tax=Pseudonocardia sp. Ae717_Ps2 TaxID=1885573 RepID=UPI00094AE19C
MVVENWVSPLSTGGLLSIAVGAIAVLLVAIIRFKVHPLLALIVVSAATAFAARIPPGAVLDVLVDGFGTTLGEVALLVGLGAMFGRLAETSGAARALSDALVARFTEQRAPLALGVVSLLFGFPIFFDAAFMVMLPIIFTIARRVGGGVLIHALPAAAALSTVHVFLPPHPGAVAATVLLGADVGLVILIGVLVAVPTWYLGAYLYSVWIGQRIVLPVPDLLTGGPLVDHAADGTAPPPPPRPGTVVALLLLPLVLIFANTTVATLGKTGTIDHAAAWAEIVMFIGSTPIALLITVLIASHVLGTRRGQPAAVVEDLLDNALKPIASVVFITGAGGMFGAVLIASGIGDALAKTLSATGLPVIVSVFAVSAILRIALGTATVTITTAAGLLGASVVAAGLGPVQTVAVVLALAAGSSIFPHVNDASFWMIGRLLGMDVPTTFRTWSVIKTLISLVGFTLACAVFALGTLT